MSSELNRFIFMSAKRAKASAPAQASGATPGMEGSLTGRMAQFESTNLPHGVQLGMITGDAASTQQKVAKMLAQYCIPLLPWIFIMWYQYVLTVFATLRERVLFLSTNATILLNLFYSQCAAWYFSKLACGAGACVRAARRHVNKQLLSAYL